MEDRVQTLAQKVQLLEESLIMFKQEFVMKMGVVEKLLSNNNDKLSHQKERLEYESMLQKSLLASWKDSVPSLTQPQTIREQISAANLSTLTRETESVQMTQTRDSRISSEVNELGQATPSLQKEPNARENSLRSATNPESSEVPDGKNKQDDQYHCQLGTLPTSVNIVSAESSCFEPEDIEMHGGGTSSNSFDQASLSEVDEDDIDFTCSPFVEIKVEDYEEEVKVTLPNPLDENALGEQPSLAYTCNVCGGYQGSAATLRVHMAKEHTGGTGGFVCHLCGKNFAQLGNLNEHKRAHTEGNSFQCSLCHEIEFVSLDLLVSHMKRVHAIEKQVCQVCNKEFSGPTYLKRHMYIFHNNELESSTKRNKKCSLCPKSYQTRADLMVHIRSHTGDRPYTCSGCQKPFADIRNLKRHQQRFPECKVLSTSS